MDAQSVEVRDGMMVHAETCPCCSNFAGLSFVSGGHTAFIALGADALDKLTSFLSGINWQLVEERGLPHSH